MPDSNPTQKNPCVKFDVTPEFPVVDTFSGFFHLDDTIFKETPTVNIKLIFLCFHQNLFTLFLCGKTDRKIIFKCQSRIYPPFPQSYPQ